MASDVPETMRSCEACGGGTQEDECQWCSGGFQSAAQQQVWRQFRKRMQHISGTYGFLEDIVQDLINRLRLKNSDEAEDLAEEGLVLLRAWRGADPTDGGRDVYTELLKAFNRQALDELTK